MNHYNRSNVLNQERKLKVGSYVEVSIDNLTEYMKREDDGAVIYVGVVVNAFSIIKIFIWYIKISGFV